MNLLSLRNQISSIDHDYKNGQTITEFRIGGTILLTRWKFDATFTGEKRPTRYALLYVPLTDYTYTEFRKTIYIVDYDLAAILKTFGIRLYEQSEKQYLDYCEKQYLDYC